MSEPNVSRTNKLVNTFCDVTEKAVSQWESEFIQTNVPRILDWVVHNFKEKIKSWAEKEPEQKEAVLPTMDTFLKGIECGEWRKEMAMIYGMEKAGLSKEQIQKIVEYSRKAWEPREI